jgi:hypothetical protein
VYSSRISHECKDEAMHARNVTFDDAVAVDLWKICVARRRSVGKPKEKEDENESFPNINFYNYKDE